MAEAGTRDAFGHAQLGGVGPMLGQAHHFLHFNPGKAPYAEERYAKEVKAARAFLARYNQTHSLRPVDYADVTRNASYFVALVREA